MRRPAQTHTVVVADDDEGVREVVVEALRQRGWTVVEAGNGLEA